MTLISQGSSCIPSICIEPDTASSGKFSLENSGKVVVQKNAVVMICQLTYFLCILRIVQISCVKKGNPEDVKEPMLRFQSLGAGSVDRLHFFKSV